MLTDALSDQNTACLFWSAWSLALFGNAKGVATLRKIAQTKSPHAEQAAEVVAGCYQLENLCRGWSI
jgi:hypothetical protein